ncbi:MAG TPA: hypothetical protein VK183_00500, partial [Flavobacterium sp.]|nr:hypothetical protein [Flavobacterium sp.]
MRRNTRHHTLLFLILLVDSVNELLTSTLNLLGLSKHPVLDINFILHNLLWMWLLSKLSRNPLIARYMLVVFLLIAAANLSFFEGTTEFNFVTIIVGGLFYILLFTLENYRRLQEEDYAFFFSNHYLLLFAPVVFFFSYGVLLSFRSH